MRAPIDQWYIFIDVPVFYHKFMCDEYVAKNSFDSFALEQIIKEGALIHCYVIQKSLYKMITNAMLFSF